MNLPATTCRACGVAMAAPTPTGLCPSCRDELGLHHPSAPAQRPRGPCTRCGGRQIIRAQVRNVSPLGMRSASLTSDVRSEGTVDLSRQRGLLEAYTCRKCGFTEWYALEPEDIPIGPAYGTELIDLDDEGGPYR